MASLATPYISVKEYLAQEEISEEHHEYLDSETFLIEAASPAHATIASNIIIETGLQLRNSPGRVRGLAMDIRTSPSGLYSYADAVISCIPEQFDGNILLNPVVIVEVLSESTGDYVRGRKFERYRNISSFTEYLMVAQDRVYVEHHVRESQFFWTMREFRSADDVISFKAVNIQLPCSVIHADVEFAGSSEAQRDS